MTYTTEKLRGMRRDIGLNIHYHRARRKMTLDELAAATGMPRDMIDRYEIGKGEIPLDVMLKIACVLGVEAGEFFTAGTSRRARPRPCS